MPKDLNLKKSITSERIEEDLKNAHEMDFKIDSDQIVFFSDIHKGTKKKNDVFRQNELIYCIALDQYFKEGFTLVQVGDIEEGWGFRIRKTLKKYENTILKFESKFLNSIGKRYFRIYGNHDTTWRKPEKVNSILKPELTNNPDIDLTVKPSLKIGNNIVVLHGHQGSLESDIFWKVAKGFVRIFTALIFRTFGRNKKRAANNQMVRHERDLALNKWATKEKKLLIAGHTHKYLFGDKHSLKSSYKNLRKLQSTPTNELNDVKKLLLNEAIKGHQEKYLKYLHSTKAEVSDLNENCYFNIGAGVYSDGITCIEINKGKIKLMWWQNSMLTEKKFIDVLTNNASENSIKPVELFSEDLNKVLEKIKEG